MGVFDLVDPNFKITIINMLQNLEKKMDKRMKNLIISTEKRKLKQEPNGNSRT